MKIGDLKKNSMSVYRSGVKNAFIYVDFYYLDELCLSRNKVNKKTFYIRNFKMYSRTIGKKR